MNEGRGWLDWEVIKFRALHLKVVIKTLAVTTEGHASLADISHTLNLEPELCPCVRAGGLLMLTPLAVPRKLMGPRGLGPALGQSPS